MLEILVEATVEEFEKCGTDEKVEDEVPKAEVLLEKVVAEVLP